MPKHHVLVRFRIVQVGEDTLFSEPIEGVAHSLSTNGLTVEVPKLEASGLHVSFNRLPGTKNRLYLMCELPNGEAIKAVGETQWFERIPSKDERYLVGIKFLELQEEDQATISAYLERPTRFREPKPARNSSKEQALE